MWWLYLVCVCKKNSVKRSLYVLMCKAMSTLCTTPIFILSVTCVLLPVWRVGSGSSLAWWGLWAGPASLGPGSPAAGSLARLLSSSLSPSLHPFSPFHPPAPPEVEEEELCSEWGSPITLLFFMLSSLFICCCVLWWLVYIKLQIVYCIYKHCTHAVYSNCMFLSSSSFSLITSLSEALFFKFNAIW